MLGKGLFNASQRKFIDETASTSLLPRSALKRITVRPWLDKKSADARLLRPRKRDKPVIIRARKSCACSSSSKCNSGRFLMSGTEEAVQARLDAEDRAATPRGVNDPSPRELCTNKSGASPSAMATARSRVTMTSLAAYIRRPQSIDKVFMHSTIFDLCTQPPSELSPMDTSRLVLRAQQVHDDHDPLNTSVRVDDVLKVTDPATTEGRHVNSLRRVLRDLSRAYPEMMWSAQKSQSDAKGLPNSSGKRSLFKRNEHHRIGAVKRCRHKVEVVCTP